MCLKAAQRCCDSLSNLYLWHIKYSIEVAWNTTRRVVIRFQICIFDILNTAKVKFPYMRTGCDSLSNLYLWHIKYSTSWRYDWTLGVVIRFQICIFDILNTACIKSNTRTKRCDSLSNLYLWHIKYSNGIFYIIFVLVVIRFQICIFDILNTASFPHIINTT